MGDGQLRGGGRIRHVVLGLIVVEVALLAVAGALTWTERASTLSASIATRSGESPPVPRSVPAPAQASARTAPATPLQGRIDPDTGVAGPLRLGMSVATATAALAEEPVWIQRAGGGSRRFEVAYPTAAVHLQGSGATVDTIAISGGGRASVLRTDGGVRIGSAPRSVPRNWATAQQVCSSEWWVRVSQRRTMRITVGRRITKITLTDRRQPAFVTCS